jgi:hypothetical protein
MQSCDAGYQALKNALRPPTLLTPINNIRHISIITKDTHKHNKAYMVGCAINGKNFRCC